MASIDEITSPELSPRCMTCRLDAYIAACPEDADWRTRGEYMRRLYRCVAENSDHMTAPEISHELGLIRREMFGGGGLDFTQIKHHFNQLVLGLEERILQRMEQSENPLELAIRCSLVGNFIDFGQTGSVDEGRLLELVEDAATMELDREALTELEARLREAKSITFLTDNCGEIVFDKMLIEQIHLANPEAQVRVIVRGAPASNDATMEDALEVGMDKVATVFGNGDYMAGTVLSRVNEQTRAALRDSDLVISKGLANLETLSGRGSNVRFLFLCKCDLYEDIFKVPLHTGLIVKGV